MVLRRNCCKPAFRTEQKETCMCSKAMADQCKAEDGTLNPRTCVCTCGDQLCFFAQDDSDASHCALSDDDADSVATAARYAKAGARTVLVKNGPAEILIHADNTVTTISPEKITAVVDTTAAGDSFNAGYLAAIVQGASEVEAAAAGSVLAGKVIRSRGALVAQAT